MWSRHNYFGPGTSDYTTTPVDVDDEIAKEHDLLYERAISFRDIQQADVKAIGKFTDDVFNTGNWHSLVGAVGLGIKAVVEKALGTNVYPFTLQAAKGRTADHSTKGIYNTPTDSENEVIKRRRQKVGIKEGVYRKQLKKAARRRTPEEDKRNEIPKTTRNPGRRGNKKKRIGSRTSILETATTGVA